MPIQLNTTCGRLQHLIKKTFKIIKKDINAVGLAKEIIERTLNDLLLESFKLPTDYDDLKTQNSETKLSSSKESNSSSAEGSQIQSLENETLISSGNLNVQDNFQTKNNPLNQGISEEKNNPSPFEEQLSPEEIAKKLAKEYLESIGVDPELLEKKKKKPKKEEKTNLSLVAIKTTEIKHEDYEHGSSCPCCEGGTLYDTQNPGSQKEFEVKVQLTIHETLFQRLRCGKCGIYFTAKNDNPSAERLTPETKVCFAVMRSEGGLPFHRSSHLFSMFGINLSKSLIFQGCEDVANAFELVMPCMRQEIANAPIFHIDDTTFNILEVSRREKDPNYKSGTLKNPNERLTSRASIIIGTDLDSNLIGCIFIPSEKHCGENFEDIIQLRTVKETPLLMADMSTCSDSPDFKKNKKLDGILGYIRAGCNDHSVVKLKEAAKSYPNEINPLLERYKKVYEFDKEFSKYGHEYRLNMHKKFSLPIMEEMLNLAKGLLNGPDPRKKVEPNSSAGKALKYFVKYYSAFIKFTEILGAPLSNTAAERAAKKPILIRKNSYFFQTLNGAKVTGLLNTATHTCHMLGGNPYEYLLDLLKNIKQVKENPASWTPFMYYQRQQEDKNQEIENLPQVSSVS